MEGSFPEVHPSADILWHLTHVDIFFYFGSLTLGDMPIAIVILLFVLILGCLWWLVRSEYRRFLRHREARLFDRLYNSRF